MALSCVVSERINAAPQAVFAIATDFSGAPQRISGIKRVEMLTPGPVGLGTRFRETRIMFGKEASETMEVVEFEPGRSYTLSAFNCGCEYRTRVSVHAAEGAATSELSFEFAGTPRTTVARIMTLLMGWMMKGACIKAIRQDLADVKKAAEGGC